MQSICSKLYKYFENEEVLQSRNRLLGNLSFCLPSAVFSRWIPSPPFSRISQGSNVKSFVTFPFQEAFGVKFAFSRRFPVTENNSKINDYNYLEIASKTSSNLGAVIQDRGYYIIWLRHQR